MLMLSSSMVTSGMDTCDDAGGSDGGKLSCVCVMIVRPLARAAARLGAGCGVGVGEGEGGGEESGEPGGIGDCRICMSFTCWVCEHSVDPSGCACANVCQLSHYTERKHTNWPI